MTKYLMNITVDNRLIKSDLYTIIITLEYELIFKTYDWACGLAFVYMIPYLSSQYKMGKKIKYPIHLGPRLILHL